VIELSGVVGSGASLVCSTCARAGAAAARTGILLADADADLNRVK